MDRLWRVMEVPDTFASAPTIEAILLSLAMAFVLGQLLAWVYCWTHDGLSYSRSYTQSLILMTMVVTIVMIVIGNNIVTAFGLIGALAIIRFRNVLKDTRDTVFVFGALVQGMAVGSERYATALIGTGALILVILYVSWTDFGSRGGFDGYLRFLVSVQPPAGDFAEVLRRHCRASRQLAMQRSAAGPASQCTYQVRLRDPGRGEELVMDLEQTAGVENVSLVLHEDTAEV